MPVILVTVTVHTSHGTSHRGTVRTASGPPGELELANEEFPARPGGGPGLYRDLHVLRLACTSTYRYIPVHTGGPTVTGYAVTSRYNFD